MAEPLTAEQALIEGIISRVIQEEGGDTYTDNPDDAGGPTKYGITQATLTKYGYPGNVKDLTEQVAREIYRSRYVTEPQFDKVLSINARIGQEVIDTGVNCGQATSAKFLQRSLNALNKQTRLYPDIPVDGLIGPATLNALRLYIHKRGAEAVAVLLKALNALQGAAYIQMAEHNQKNETFIYGWFKNRIGM